MNHGLRLGPRQSYSLLLSKVVLVLDSRAVGVERDTCTIGGFRGPSNHLARAKADLDELIAVQESLEGSSL